MIVDFQKNKLLTDMNELFEKIYDIPPTEGILHFWKVSNIKVLQIKLEELKKQHAKKIKSK